MPAHFKKIVKNHEILKLMGRANFASLAYAFRTQLVATLEDRNMTWVCKSDALDHTAICVRARSSGKQDVRFTLMP